MDFEKNYQIYTFSHLALLHSKYQGSKAKLNSLNETKMYRNACYYAAFSCYLLSYRGYLHISDNLCNTY